MKLTQSQVESFERDGYLFFPGLFRPDEVKVLLDEVPALYAQRRPENVRGVEPHPTLQASGLHSASRFHADSMPAGRLSFEELRRSASLEGKIF